jgi:Immunity protein Imm1
MTYRVAYDISETALPNVDAAVKFLGERPLRIATHGKRAASYWFAPTGADDVLRLDIDYDAERAALRWLPDGSHAIEVPEGESIVVMESSDCDVVTIPAELARVSVQTAHRAVVEYVSTGQRPRCVEWVTDDRRAPVA